MLRLQHLKRLANVYLGRSVSFCTNPSEIQDILSKHLGLSSDIIKDVLKLDSVLFNTPKRHLVWNCTMLQKMNVDLRSVDYLINCLNLQPQTLNNRIFLLQELGVEGIDLVYICRFPLSMQKSVKSFKRIHNIPPEHDMIKSISAHVNIQPSFPIFKDSGNRLQIKELYNMYMVYYKSCHLKLHYQSIVSRRLYQSFRQLNKLLTILKDTFKFDNHYLKKHGYLLNLCPVGINLFLSELKDVTIGDMDIIQLIRKFPRILWQDIDDVRDLIEIIKQLNMEDSIVPCLRIFTIKKDVFLERYQNIVNDTDLSLWSKHPRLLCMIHSLKTVKDRANYLSVIDRMNNANIHTFLSTRQFFTRYVQGAVSHVALKKFLRYVVYKELGTDKEYVLQYIMRHPHWKQMSLYTIERMIIFLKQNYSDEDICKNIHVTLYPQRAVDKILKNLYEEYTPQKGYNFTPSQYLALCLYKLEKDNHFNGDSVWQVMYHEKPSSNLNSTKDTNENEQEHNLDDIVTDGTLMPSMNNNISYTESY